LRFLDPDELGRRERERRPLSGTARFAGEAIRHFDRLSDRTSVSRTKQTKSFE